MIVQQDKQLGFESGVSIDSVSVQRGGNSILSNISLQLPKGKLIALLGPSGAGKSTLMKCVLGLMEPTRGRVAIAGSPLSKAGPVGYVPQDDCVHRELTVAQELDYAVQLRRPALSDAERASVINEVLEQVNLSDRKNHRIRKLSGGQRKRVSVALELVTSPEVLILDEPTSGLDPGMEAKMMELFSGLAKEGRTMIVSTHAMESIHCCDYVIFLMQGKLIYFGSPQQALGYFGEKRFVGIFHELESRSASDWAQAWRSEASGRGRV